MAAVCAGADSIQRHEIHVPGIVTIELEEPSTLCMKDTGIGISPEDLPRIFEKGYTGCNGRTDKKASGLGLYLCRRICDNLGHSIQAESVPERERPCASGLSRKRCRETEKQRASYRNVRNAGEM